MKISFAVTTHNEGECIERLLSQLQSYIEDNPDNEVVILDDFSDDSETSTIIEYYSNLSYMHLHKRQLNRNFGEHKSYLNSLCKGKYIFQIDADEYLSTELLDSLSDIIDGNSSVDLFFIPRVNVVEGLTDEHIDMWKWVVNDQGWVNFPDWQTRLYQNTPDIMWVGQVHERITGHSSYAVLPPEEKFSIIHIKDISTQETQNLFYSEILQQ